MASPRSGLVALAILSVSCILVQSAQDPEDIKYEVLTNVKPADLVKQWVLESGDEFELKLNENEQIVGTGIYGDIGPYEQEGHSGSFIQKDNNTAVDGFIKVMYLTPKRDGLLYCIRLVGIKSHICSAAMVKKQADEED